MAEGKRDSNWVNITIGTIMIVLNLWWIYSSAERFYCQNCGCGILYYVLIPNWILIINIIGGNTGAFLAVKMIKKRISAWTTISINFGLFCFCILIFSVL